jgi:hypothetical protein
LGAYGLGLRAEKSARVTAEEISPVDRFQKLAAEKKSVDELPLKRRDSPGCKREFAKRTGTRETLGGIALSWRSFKRPRGCE